MKIGIVGLPNVGKSTLFNALTTSKNAQAANYPFCTIEPNVGVVRVPDPRVDFLSAHYKAKSTIYATIEFVDIAGLVRGASKGEGLGNRFLAKIREVDAIVHVVRAFEGDVIHVEGSVNPARDIETINLELEIADLEVKERRTQKGKGEDAAIPMLMQKPVIFALNVTDPANAQVPACLKGQTVVCLNAQLECEIANISDAGERAEFMAAYDLKESGLDRLARVAYDKLGLISFLTAGEQEVRAWTITRGSKAPEAAGKIHTDFEKGFIRAEVVSYDDFVSCGGLVQAREKGRVRIEGKDYVVSDGDIIHFRFNVSKEGKE